MIKAHPVANHLLIHTATDLLLQLNTGPTSFDVGPVLNRSSMQIAHVFSTSMMSGHVIYFRARRELSPQSVLHQRIVLSAGEEGFNKKSAKWRGQGRRGGGMKKASSAWQILGKTTSTITLKPVMLYHAKVFRNRMWGKSTRSKAGEKEATFILFNPFSAGTDFIPPHLTSIDVRYGRIKYVLALKEWNISNGRRPVIQIFTWSGKS